MLLHPVQNTAAIRSGDTCFQQAVAEYGPALSRYCQHLTGDRWDADDLVQDTLLKALVASRRNHQSMCRAFLYRIAHHAWIDKCRTRKQTVPLQDDLQAEEGVDGLEVRDALLSLLQQLPPRQQVAVVLKDVFAWSLQDVARHLGVSSGAVKALLYRARQTLAEHEADESAGMDGASPLADENVIAACLAALNRQDPQAFLILLARIHLQANTSVHLLHQSRVQALRHGNASFQAPLGMAA